MGFKTLHFKLKAFRLRRTFLVADGSKEKENDRRKKPSWMMPISHGYHVVENHLLKKDDSTDSDSVVVQREQIQELELWFFGVFDSEMGDGVTKYLQSHLFDRNPNESQVRRKSKETIRKAYLGARAKIKETQKSDDENETWKLGSASVLVINGEKLVIANMGDYRVVVCKNGVAHQLSSKYHQANKRHWSRRLFSVKMRMWGWKSSKLGNSSKQSKGSELVIGSERIDSDTEFVIIASNGIWEVMKNQEAVSLIRHMEDPQEASECLAKEGLSRMTRSNISCLVIRFD